MFISGVSDVKSNYYFDNFVVLCYLNVNRPKTIHNSVNFRAFRKIPVHDYRCETANVLSKKKKH